MGFKAAKIFNLSVNQDYVGVSGTVSVAIFFPVLFLLFVALDLLYSVLIFININIYIYQTLISKATSIP